MKIGINARYIDTPFVGIGQVTLRLISKLSEFDKENEYFLFVSNEIDTENLNLGENFQVIEIPEMKLLGKGFAKVHWEQIAVPSACEKIGVDLYHVLYEAAPMFRQPFPVITCVHDTIPWKVSDHNKKLTTKLRLLANKVGMKNSDFITTVSINAKIDIISLLGINYEEKIVVLPNGRSDVFTPNLVLENRNAVLGRFNIKRPFILHVGNYEKRKNLKKALEAFAIYIEKYKQDNLDFLIIGPTPKVLNEEIYFEPSKLSIYADELGLKGRVKFLGVVSEKDLITLYAMAECLVYPSIYEGFGVPIIEAFSSLTPVVTSYMGTLMEVSKGNAIYVDPFNAESIADGINEAITNESLISKITIAGYKISNFYSWDETARRTLELYRIAKERWDEKNKLLEDGENKDGKKEKKKESFDNVNAKSENMKQKLANESVDENSPEKKDYQIIEKQE